MNEQLIEEIKTMGVLEACIISVSEIPFDPELRRACEANLCGNYGRNWTCPPDCGDVYELIERAKAYQFALVYQTVSTLEDSYDYEGMQEGLRRHTEITGELSKLINRQIQGTVLQLSAGGCKLCDKCAKIDSLPCRNPEKAVVSLEAYGIFVSGLAKTANMNYINGANTVTYFGAFLFN